MCLYSKLWLFFEHTERSSVSPRCPKCRHWNWGGVMLGRTLPWETWMRWALDAVAHAWRLNSDLKLLWLLLWEDQNILGPIKKNTKIPANLSQFSLLQKKRGRRDCWSTEGRDDQGEMAGGSGEQRREIIVLNAYHASILDAHYLIYSLLQRSVWLPGS